MNPHFVNYAIDVSDLLTAIVGGIIGALAAGIPAYMIARQQSRELLSRDTEARTREERALALTTSVKLIQIVNSIVGLRTHVEACFQSTDDRMEPWQRLIPMVGHSDEATIRFNDGEIALLARAKEAALMQDLLLIANRHSSAVVSWQEYCKRRDDLVERAPKPTSFEGERGTTHLTVEQVNQLKVYTIPLNNLALTFRDFLNEDMQFARRILERLPAAYESYFGVTKFVEFAFPSEEDFEAKVKAAAELLTQRHQYL